MKMILLLCNLLFYLSVVHAQSYEYMYKKDTSNAAVINNKKGNHYLPENILKDSSDTSKIIGFAVAPLYKKQPESPLGNLMADCMKLYAEKVYNKKVDAAFVNFGSMRSYIPKGDITVGAVLKVMPYDNKVVLIAMQGNVLKQLLSFIATLGGWPCAGINMSIKNRQIIDIQINGLPLDELKTYTIATSDYIANGGNQCVMLKGLPQLNNNYSFQTALINYIISFTQAGKPVTAPIQNRIVYIKE